MTASLLEQLDIEPAFVAWARGRSLAEAFDRAPRGDWLVHLAMRVGIVSRADLDALMVQSEALGKMMRSLIRSLQRREAE